MKYFLSEIVRYLRQTILSSLDLFRLEMAQKIENNLVNLSAMMFASCWCAKS